MKFKKSIVLLIGTLLLLSAAGCGKDESKEQIGIRGQITALVKNSGNKLSGILVEGKQESDTAYDKATVSISRNTKIFKGTDKQKLSVEDLKEKMTVEVVFEGPVAESYPVQAKAKIVRVLQ
ncbi:MAG: YobA family protein [Clostridia bacterium]|nr:YobA family protein [Clostridia bacterium]